MDLGFSGNVLKFLVFFFNGIVFIGGGLMGGFGVYFLMEAMKTGGAVTLFLPIGITAVGFSLFLISFLGWFAACTKNVCLLRMFAAIVGILLLAEIGCAVFLFIYRGKFVDVVGEEFKKAINETQMQEDEKGLTFKSLIKMQKELKCCGGVGSSDWATIPPSCCEEESDPCVTPYETGCAEAIYEKLRDSTLMFVMVILAICAIQIGAIICAACLAKKVQSRRPCSSVEASGEAAAEGGDDAVEEAEIQASAE